MAILYDPLLLALVFAASTFAVFGSATLAGVMRAQRRERGRIVHILTAANGAIALGVLGLLALGIDPGLGIVLGLVAGLGAGLFWLVGALVARARPVWVDLMVIVSALSFLVSYAEIAADPGNVPSLFPGLTIPGPDAPP